MKAMAHGFPAVAQALLRYSASTTRADKDGLTSLHFLVRLASAEEKYVPFLEDVLERNEMDTNVYDRNGRTALMYGYAEVSDNHEVSLFH